ncbi:ABC transporter permease [Yersinia alsatica]|uniref:Transport permease protein n=1 Tax=Yersinia alsatica TaxID=2890317 RepID=A0ABY5UVW5_9GAMM|nr:ABC transporter permease [Yersinia alsatica]OWF69790.1 sugar ABC transporter permease [Yersinia frederiksenii]UWM46322.1 ABC transporter permease [Yersinia alsatica]CNK46770.1 lipopolysaccharide transport system permease [Yersinia frederiksenii]CNL26826.1 lipopolysaccharide transport system permease [Yersinia frederiksenii]
MNPHTGKPYSLASLFGSSWSNRHLIYQMIKREIIGRYRGSFMGILWSFINPIFMLAVYTLVFSVVFKARWAGAAENESRTQFAVILFVGLIVHGLFAEVLNRSPSLIISNVNYVKKVIFPLETLPLVTMGGVLFHSFISIVVLISAFFIFNGYVHLTLLFLPLVLAPLIFLTLGLSWFLASLGVYVRDVGQTITILMTVMMFLSPVFYPITSLPETLRPLIMMNPLTFIIEQARAVLIWGKMPNFIGLGVYSAISLLVMWLGYAWFQKTRRGFADVL